MNTRPLLPLCAILFSTACPDRFDVDENPESTTGGDASDDGTETNDCEPGQAGCVCLEGLCEEGLSCVSGQCVDIGVDSVTSGPRPDDGGSSDPGTSESGGAAGSCVEHCGEIVSDGTGGSCSCAPSCIDQDTCCADYEDACPAPPDGCDSNAACRPQEVCSAGTQTCVPAFGHGYDIQLHFVDDPSIFSDVYFSLIVGAPPGMASPFVTNVNEAYYTFEAITIQPDLAMIWAALDWHGSGYTELIVSCFVASGSCGPVPIEALKNGKASATHTMVAGRRLDVYFTPR